MNLINLGHETVLYDVKRSTKCVVACFINWRDEPGSLKNVSNVLGFEVFLVSRRLMYCSREIISTSGMEYPHASSGNKGYPSRSWESDALVVSNSYHSYLRKLCCRVKYVNSMSNMEVALQIAVNAANDTPVSSRFFQVSSSFIPI